MNPAFERRIFSVRSRGEFDAFALEIFTYQAEYNPVYSLFLDGLGIKSRSVKRLTDIPFLPVEFFRNHRVVTGIEKESLIFESSGTTGSAASRHFVTDVSLYEKSFTAGFSLFYGDPGSFFIAALLPSYIEKGNSSLVYMADRLIRLSASNGSGFFHNDPAVMLQKLALAKEEGKKAMLIGVTYALLDLAEKYSPDLSGVKVVETGGMKGRRKEMTREELHAVLRSGLNIEKVHSEYGMTELLSQAWSDGDGVFKCPPWMKIMLREINDPLSSIEDQMVTGGINIIDLANINSCSFIATADLGRLLPGGGFEVLGRFDNSDVRGCNLLVQ